ncbi:PASTA domain-containing protein [Saccharomonospora iraqiensis]|uniref:PASTA domain-containing protein n=1 Tax=Saccharomonospora iraqiensis TaxID=52698 RepID=UPI00022E040D|nr:hypothetical protein [Saccharomonospora iraqiensis]
MRTSVPRTPCHPLRRTLTGLAGALALGLTTACGALVSTGDGAGHTLPGSVGAPGPSRTGPPQADPSGTPRPGPSGTPGTATVREVPGVVGLLLATARRDLDDLGLGVEAHPVDGHLIALNDANWRVVGQAPGAGEALTVEGTVVLGVEKTAEAESRWCGDGDC